VKRAAPVLGPLTHPRERGERDLRDGVGDADVRELAEAVRHAVEPELACIQERADGEPVALLLGVFERVLREEAAPAAGERTCGRRVPSRPDALVRDRHQGDQVGDVARDVSDHEAPHTGVEQREGERDRDVGDGLHQLRREPLAELELALESRLVEPDRAAQEQASGHDDQELVEPRLVEEVRDQRRQRDQDDGEREARDDHQAERGAARLRVGLARDHERRPDPHVVEDAEQADRDRRQREETEVGRHQDARERDRREQAQRLVARVREHRERNRPAGARIHQESISAASCMRRSDSLR
jgi:hypothetical protein